MKAFSALLYLPSTAQGRNKISAYNLLTDQSYRAGTGNKTVHFSKFQLARQQTEENILTLFCDVD